MKLYSLTEKTTDWPSWFEHVTVQLTDRLTDLLND